MTSAPTALYSYTTSKFLRLLLLFALLIAPMIVLGEPDSSGNVVDVPEIPFESEESIGEEVVIFSDAGDDNTNGMAATAEETGVEPRTDGFFDALSPGLIRDGAESFKNLENDREKEVVEFTGRIFFEQHPIGLRKNLRRWVLSTDNGKRIPLSSTLSLMKQVKGESVLDEPVKVSGRMIRSSEEGVAFLSVSEIKIYDPPEEVEPAEKEVEHLVESSVADAHGIVFLDDYSESYLGAVSRLEPVENNHYK